MVPARDHMTMSLVKPVPPDQLPDNLTKIGCVEQYTKSKRGLFIPATVLQWWGRFFWATVQPSAMMKRPT